MFAPLRGAHRTLIAWVMAVSMAPGLAIASDAPSALVTNLNQQALPLVSAETANTAKLEDVIDAHADIDAVLKRALKRQWQSLSDAQRDELKAQTLTLIGKAYASAMQGVDGKDIAYRTKSSKSKSARIATTITKSGNTVKVDYRLRLRDNGWKVVDVIISGVSIVAVYSADFEAVLAHKGVDGLIAALRERNS